MVGEEGGIERTAHKRVRAAAGELGRPVAILADLSGPKLRVGQFAGGSIDLVSGHSVVVRTRSVTGEPGLIPSQYQALAHDVLPGNRILLDDGILELRVESVNGTEVACTVVDGGTLSTTEVLERTRGWPYDALATLLGGGTVELGA